MKTIKTLLLSIRAPFLILTPICVFLGVSIVLNSKSAIDISMLLLVFSGALFAHISVNTFNEYLDFKSGLDLITKRTPFSGGSGALVQNPQMLGAVLNIGILSLILTLSIGIFFLWKHGISILPIGLLGAFLIISYTSWINKHPLLCLIAPGFGFGFLFVLGTQYVLSGVYFNQTFLIALVPFFLVNNLLLLNQYPDIEADKKSGRNHFPIAFGIKKSNLVYGLFVLLSTITIISLVVFSYLPLFGLVALIPIPLALFSLSGAIKYGENIGQHPQYLAMNVIVALLVPLLLSISLVISGS